jgi:hypothetical protein
MSRAYQKAAPPSHILLALSNQYEAKINNASVLNHNHSFKKPEMD